MNARAWRHDKSLCNLPHPGLDHLRLNETIRQHKCRRIQRLRKLSQAIERGDMELANKIITTHSIIAQEHSGPNTTERYVAIAFLKSRALRECYARLMVLVAADNFYQHGRCATAIVEAALNGIRLAPWAKDDLFWPYLVKHIGH